MTHDDVFLNEIIWHSIVTLSHPALTHHVNSNGNWSIKDSRKLICVLSYYEQMVHWGGMSAHKCHWKTVLHLLFTSLVYMMLNPPRNKALQSVQDRLALAADLPTGSKLRESSSKQLSHQHRWLFIKSAGFTHIWACSTHSLSLIPVGRWLVSVNLSWTDYKWVHLSLQF